MGRVRVGKLAASKTCAPKGGSIAEVNSCCSCPGPSDAHPELHPKCTPSPSRFVATPRLTRPPAAGRCRVSQIWTLATHHAGCRIAPGAYLALAGQMWTLKKHHAGCNAHRRSGYNA